MSKTTRTELWQIAYTWLRALGSRPNKYFTKDEISTHPDYSKFKTKYL